MVFCCCDAGSYLTKCSAKKNEENQFSWEFHVGRNRKKQQSGQHENQANHALGKASILLSAHQKPRHMQLTIIYFRSGRSFPTTWEIDVIHEAAGVFCIIRLSKRWRCTHCDIATTVLIRLHFWRFILPKEQMEQIVLVWGTIFPNHPPICAWNYGTPFALH